MVKWSYAVLVAAIAITTAGVFYIASVINLHDVYGVERSTLGQWVIYGIIASVIVVILAALADKHKS